MKEFANYMKSIWKFLLCWQEESQTLPLPQEDRYRAILREELALVFGSLVEKATQAVEARLGTEEGFVSVSNLPNKPEDLD